MLERFLYSGDFRRWGVRWIGCGSEHTWIGLDWVSEFVDWVGFEVAKWTHVQLWYAGGAGNNVCSRSNGGCSHICVPFSRTVARCLCPSRLALGSDRKTCTGKSNLVDCNICFLTCACSAMRSVVSLPCAEQGRSGAGMRRRYAAERRSGKHF